MSEARFTPGPWRHYHDGHGGMRIESAERQIGYASSAGDKQEGNARLMAAAPEMYEALQRIDRELVLGAELDRIVASAIAKATGEQP